jgi:hypothetical protein
MHAELARVPEFDSIVLKLKLLLYAKLYSHVILNLFYSTL